MTPRISAARPPDGGLIILVRVLEARFRRQRSALEGRPNTAAATAKGVVVFRFCMHAGVFATVGDKAWDLKK